MRKNNTQKFFTLVLTGGGTAGHVWPHFALFEAKNSPLTKASAENILEVHYLGSKTGLEKQLVINSQPHWKYHSIETGKLRRYFSFKNFSDPLRIFLGFFQAFFLLKKINASLVFSKGGFVSVPVVWAAWLRKVPIVIHESDATLALATKLSLPFAMKVLVTFAQKKSKIFSLFQSKIVETGLPLRESLFTATKEEGLKFFDLDENKKTILIFGGSLGAQSLNKKIFELIPKIGEKYNIIHIVGKGNAHSLQQEWKNYKQHEFLTTHMCYAYAAADLAICRAGASSIFELAAARIPMILVPLGKHASRGDQIINAQIFVQKHWAQCINEHDFHTADIEKFIEKTFENLPEKKQALQNAPGTLSATQIGKMIWAILKKNEAKKR